MFSFNFRCPLHTVALGATCAFTLVYVIQTVQRRRLKNDKRIPRSFYKSSYLKEISSATTIALKAGEKIRAATENKEKNITNKGDMDLHDFVTQTDKDNEILIFDHLRSTFPSYLFIGEESSADTGSIPVLTDQPTWIVDPIDGTTNFVHSFPFSCVSIGLVVNKIVVVGVVYDSKADEMFVAIRGFGAYLNKTKISVSSAKKIKDSLCLTEFGYQRDESKVDIIIQCLRAIMRKGVHSVRTLGSGIYIYIYIYLYIYICIIYIYIYIM
jgi:inositol-phosphate phosphatase/L-galactose 1-phosphate phosphatase